MQFIADIIFHFSSFAIISFSHFLFTPRVCFMSDVGGYPRDLFLDKVEDLFECCICHLVLKNPMRCQDEHMFCKSCIEEWHKKSKTCPVDRKKMVEKGVYVARMARDIIDKLQIMCPTASNEKDDAPQMRKTSALLTSLLEEQCSWKGPVGEVHSHLSKCQEIRIKCSDGCPHVCRRGDMSSHVCLYEYVACEKCSTRYMRKDKDSHEHTCTKWPTPCGNTNCSVIVSKDQLKEHHDVCPMELVCCEWRETIGCPAMVHRKDLNTHNKNAGAHMSHLIQKIAALETNLISKCEHIENLEGQLAEQKIAFEKSLKVQDNKLRRYECSLEKQKTADPYWISYYHVWYIQNFDVLADMTSDSFHMCGCNVSLRLSPCSSENYHAFAAEFENCLSETVKLKVTLFNRKSSGQDHEFTGVGKTVSKRNFNLFVEKFIKTKDLERGMSFIDANGGARLKCMLFVQVNSSHIGDEHKNIEDIV